MHKAYKSRVISFFFFRYLRSQGKGKALGLRKLFGGEVRRRLTRMAVIRLQTQKGFFLLYFFTLAGRDSLKVGGLKPQPLIKLRRGPVQGFRGLREGEKSVTQGEKVGHKGLSLRSRMVFFSFIFYLSWLRGKGEVWGLGSWGYQEVRGEGGRGYNGQYNQNVKSIKDCETGILAG